MGSSFWTELYAAREKNGVYIPREQYLADEAEKKVLTPFIAYDILDCAYSSIAWQRNSSGYVRETGSFGAYFGIKR